MTVAAESMESGKFYRLTREPWPGVYYMRCAELTRRQLEKRLSAKDPRAMTPDERRAWQVLCSCRENGTVLGVRLLRFRDEGGAKHETREYVAFPLDYPLREVSKPPGYTVRKTKGGIVIDGDSEEEDDSTEACGAGRQDTG